MPAWGVLNEKCLMTPPRTTGPYMGEPGPNDDHLSAVNDVQEVKKSELERNVRYLPPLPAFPFFLIDAQLEFHYPASR